IKIELIVCLSDLSKWMNESTTEWVNRRMGQQARYARITIALPILPAATAAAAARTNAVTLYGLYHTRTWVSRR
ncbi:unnamed protein product, partial [Ceratitis capitata]